MDECGKGQDLLLFNPRRAPKSRNGCLRCKAKRLKCDEIKPICNQCKLRQCPCPGYRPKTFVWSTKHEKHLPQKSRSLRPLPSPAPALESSGSFSNAPQAIVENPVCSSDELEEPHFVTNDGNLPSPAGSQQTEIVIPSRQSPNQFVDSLSAIRQQLSCSTVPELLLHLPTMLVEYYFNYVCQIFSSFDGTLNPFRSTVGRLWDGSAPIYYAIQSMAAAYLSNHLPRMSRVGVQMQRETYKCLYQAQSGEPTEDLDKTLLTVLLVGQTTAWHDPRDLGLVHLRTAKRLNRKRLLQQNDDGSADSRISRQNEFFEQCILYWDMLGGFVDDDVDDFGFRDSPSRSAEVVNFNHQPEPNSQIFPHPWTGVAPIVHKLFAKVGRLIRKYRKHMAQEAASFSFLSPSFDFGSDFLPQGFSASTDAILQAQTLEEELLGLRLPEMEELVDAGDENTPVRQYLYLAEAYQSAALLEIYKVFPSILLRRLPDTTAELIASDPSAVSYNNSQDTNHRLFEIVPQPTITSTDEFLVSLAVHIITLLEKLPPNSGTRCLQPLVLISAASELRFPSTSDPLTLDSFLSPFNDISVSNPNSNGPYFPLSDLGIASFSSSVPLTLNSNPNPTPNFDSITSKELDIASARKFVVTRLQEFQSSLPAKPILKAEMIVKETWAQWDAGEVSVYWMDVMDARGWGSIFG